MRVMRHGCCGCSSNSGSSGWDDCRDRMGRESGITCGDVLFLEDVDSICNTTPLLVGVVVRDGGHHMGGGD